MKKYLWILGVLFFGGLAAFAFFATDSFRKPEHKSYEPTPLTFVIDWEISKPMILQVIYIKDKKDVFSQKNSVWKHVNPEDKHVELVIPADRIYNFRVDFKFKPGKIVIKNIEIKGDMYLNFNHWKDYRYANMDKTKVNDNDYLEIYSEQDDPHMVFLYPFVLDEKKAVSGEKITEKKLTSHRKTTGDVVKKLNDNEPASGAKEVVTDENKIASEAKEIAPEDNEASSDENETEPDESETASVSAETEVTPDENETTSAETDATPEEEQISANKSGIKPIIPAKKPLPPRRKFR